MAESVKGLGDVLKNLNAEIAGIQGRTIAGLLEAGILVEGRSKKRAPSEHGGAGLTGSSFTRKAHDNPLAVEVGYRNAYAIFVHENMEMVLRGKPRPSGLGVYWGPAPFPSNKFLERPARESAGDILETVRRRAKVGG